jgi:serine O-acetyltransferase
VRNVHPSNPWISNPAAARLLIFFRKHRIPYLSRAWGILLNCDFYAEMRGQVFMPHPYGIVVSANVVLGNNVVLMQQVTLGGKTLDIHDMPFVEDDVYIGAGAKVLGKVRLGKGCTVGANAVVTKDVPAGATVVGFNRILEKSQA